MGGGGGSEGSLLHHLRRIHIPYVACRESTLHACPLAILPLQSPGAWRYRLPHLEAQASPILAVVPPHDGAALLLARAGHGVHAWAVVCSDELLCAFDHVHVLLLDDLQALAEDLEADRAADHNHPDYADALGPRRQRHRGELLLFHGQLPDPVRHCVRRRRDVRLLLLALRTALPRVPPGGRQER